ARARPGALWRRRGGGGRGGAGAARARLGRGWLDPHPGLVLRHLRSQAVVRSRALGPRPARLGDAVAHRPAHAHGPRARFCRACDEGLAGLSVAWSADLGHARVDPEVADLCADAAVRFESLGCHVEVVVPTWDDPEPIFRTLAAGEAFAAYRDRLEAGERQLDPALVELLRFGQSITAEQYLAALLARREFWGGGQRFLARFAHIRR